MKTGRKVLSLLLVLILAVSLMSGAFTVSAAEGPFEADTALQYGREYVIVAESEGKYFALSKAESGFGAEEVTVEDGQIADAPESAIWVAASGSSMESLADPGNFIYAGSGGFMTYTSGRTVEYDAETQTIALHGAKYYLTFDGAAFGQGDQADAATILIFGRGEAAEPERVITLADIPVPETVKRDAVKNSDGSVTLAFTSDVHNDGEHLNLKTWLEAAEADFGYIDAMGFCGDMGSAYASKPVDYWPVVDVVFDYMDSQLEAGKIGTAIYTTGNHEWFPTAGGDFGHEFDNPAYTNMDRFMVVGEGMETDAYIIYCFGAGESAMSTSGYMKVLDTEIAIFAEWLKTAPTDKPIFVLSHYPLHDWSSRGDKRLLDNTVQIIDMLNEHPNIVFLWGHNHSNFDDNYYRPKFPGDEIKIDADGNTKTINFTYAAAGATADIEYTGPEAGSAATINKGLVVTIAADGALDFTYYTIDGQQIDLESPWFVRFRGGYGNYETLDTQYVEDGKTAEAMEAPEVEGYKFAGWYTYENGFEVPFSFDEPITRNILVTAKYRIDTGLDDNYVYLTVQMGDRIVTGKSGTPILMYPVPYEDGMTGIKAFQTMQDAEFDGETTVGSGGYGYLTDIWDCNPENGAWMMSPLAKNCYVSASDPVDAGHSYYVLTYADQEDYASASYLRPFATEVEAGETASFTGGYWTFSTSTYKYTDNPIAGDVYCGASLDALKDTGVDAVDGAFELSFDEAGTYYVAVKAEGIGLAATKVTVTAAAEPAEPEEPEEPAKPDFPKPDSIVKEAKKNEDGSINLAFTSDVHYDGKNLNLKTWLEAAEADFGYFDSMGFCGDMASAYVSTAEQFWTYTGEIMDYMDGQIAEGKVGDAVYTHGNHEWFPYAGGNYYDEYANYPAAARLLQVGEAVRTEDYIIYCFGGGEIAKTFKYDYAEEDIAELAAYLETAPKDIPIFLLTHFPLHAWNVTDPTSGRTESRYVPHAKELIEVLNQYDNIIVLWGHNHSNFDDWYYTPEFPGAVIPINPEGDTMQLNFTYLSAGCTADAEYTGPEAGSASCMNKGLVVTIGADGSLTYTYYTLDGKTMGVQAPWMVRFRDGKNYKVFETQIIEDGGFATLPDVPDMPEYAFTGWYYYEKGHEHPFDENTPITRNLLVTAGARYDTGKSTDYVYLTVELGDGIAVGKSGTPILMYPVPYEAGMTGIQAFQALQDAEFDGETTVASGGRGYLVDVWGKNPSTGMWMLATDSRNSYVSASATVTPGNCYYVYAYDEGDARLAAGYLKPFITEADAGKAIDFTGAWWVYEGTPSGASVTPIAGDVYCGKSLDALKDTGVDAVDGAFQLSFQEGGTWYVAVKAEGMGLAATVVTVKGAEAPAEPEQPAEPEVPAEPEQPAEPEETEGTFYMVVAGDTLWRIAQKYYGTGFKWDVIYAANKGIIKNPKMIYVGQVLLIP